SSPIMELFGGPPWKCSELVELDIHCGSTYRILLHVLNRSLTLWQCPTTDNSLITIVESWPLLTSLRFDDMDLTDRALIGLASARCGETITFLEVRGCRRITGVGLRQAVTRFPHLRRLIINTSVPSSLAIELFDGPPWECPELVELDIEHFKVRSST